MDGTFCNILLSWGIRSRCPTLCLAILVDTRQGKDNPIAPFKAAKRVATDGCYPYWSENALKDLLYMHLQFVSDEAVARIKKDWKGNITSFDKGRAHILHLSDALTAGIVKQFPEKF